MANFDREEQLRQLHEKRKQTTIAKVEEAIKRLTKSSKAINFNSVAAEAGVSKATQRFITIMSSKSVSISYEINKKRHL